MKILASIVLFSVSLLFIACDKTKGIQAEVIRDCTGTYLRIAGKDYHVCNTPKTASIAHGTMVIAAYTRSESCSRNEEIDCYMLHANEGWIEVKQIKKL